MEHRLTAYVVADALISSIGRTTAENVESLRHYRSGIALRQDSRTGEAPLQAALIPDDYLPSQEEDMTRFERLAVETLRQLAEKAERSLADCPLILSTTKGNISLLSSGLSDSRLPLAETARRIAAFSGMDEKRTEVVSNACISGVSAIVVAKRMIEDGECRDVVVLGCDELSPFITSGFLSFKSVSGQPCRPYDSARDGLSLGEACGALLLSADCRKGAVAVTGGAISNDANHISGPSRTGDGLYFAMRDAMLDSGISADDLSFLNLHGTATVYNDEMEAKAVALAGLEAKPVQSLKSYFGHTLGASGVIETIICCHELLSGDFWGTKGYGECGVSVPLNVESTHRRMPMRHCLKTASGFGGCNAVIVLSLPEEVRPMPRLEPVTLESLRRVTVEGGRITVDGRERMTTDAAEFGQMIREVHKARGESNMKFFKMDNMAKLGYEAAALLLEGIVFEPEEMAVILANRSASLDSDWRHQQLLNEGGAEMVSPAVFVYTLPNVTIGEICIRHKIKGENTFFIADGYDRERMLAHASAALSRTKAKYCIIGWCELLQNEYCANFELIKK